MDITIYTDGSANNRAKTPEYGGYASVILKGIRKDDDEDLKCLRQVKNRSFDIDSYRAELLAAVYALNESLKIKKVKNILLVTDCKVLYNAMEGENWIEQWAHKGFFGVKHSDLYEILLDFKKQEFNLTFKWTRGHAGNYWNEFVDKLAKEARNGR